MSLRVVVVVVVDGRYGAQASEQLEEATPPTPRSTILHKNQQPPQSLGSAVGRDSSSSASVVICFFGFLLFPVIPVICVRQASLVVRDG